MLEELVTGVLSAVSNVYGFASETSLSGVGWESAKERIYNYAALFSGIAVAAKRVSQIDARISSALSGYFGGCDRVSEQEWLDKKEEALARASYMQDLLDASRADQNSSWYITSSYEGAVRLAMEDASFAGDMLSKIYSYCAETNNAYGTDLSNLFSLIRRGCAAFAIPGFNAHTGKWNAVDQSWRADLSKAAYKIADKMLKEQSLENPDSVVYAPGFQYLYFRGRKWRIEGGEDKGYVYESDTPAFLPGWTQEDRLIVPYESLDGAMFWGLFLSGVGSSFESGVPDAWKDMAGKGINVAGGNKMGGVGAALSTFNDVGNSYQEAEYKGSIIYVFETRGSIDSRVRILVSGESSVFNVKKQGLNIITDGIYQDYHIAKYLSGTEEDRAALFYKASGLEAHGSLTTNATFNHAAREATEDGVVPPTGMIHFDKEGNPKETVVMYPGDSVTITDGYGRTVDVTEEWFAIEHDPAGATKEAVENAGN